MTPYSLNFLNPRLLQNLPDQGRPDGAAEVSEVMGRATRASAQHDRFTLLFDQIKGYSEGYRLLTGALLDSKRVALTVGLPPTLNDLELVKTFKERMQSVSGDLELYAPKYLDEAPVLGNTSQEVDLFPFEYPSR